MQTKLMISAICLVIVLHASFAVAQVATESKTESAKRADFVSDASFVVGSYAPVNRSHDAKDVVTAATIFLDSLSQEQRSQCAVELKSPHRPEWTNLPARKDADGVRLGGLNKKQVELACQLMANLFSDQGYNKMRDIMLADDQLLRGGNPRPGFGTEEFSVVIFGTPSATEPWGFQLDGHHVGVNLSIEGEKITMSPSFIGTQPHKFSIAGQDYKPFASETDLAHELAMSLNDEQVKQAVIGNKRARILAGPGRDGNIPDAKGLPVASWTKSNRNCCSS